MDDEQLTRAAAKAMGFSVDTMVESKIASCYILSASADPLDVERRFTFAPLLITDDAMALARHKRLRIEFLTACVRIDTPHGSVTQDFGSNSAAALCRAVCRCVAGE